MADEASGNDRDEDDDADEFMSSPTDPTARRGDRETDHTWQPSARPLSSDEDATDEDGSSRPGSTASSIDGFDDSSGDPDDRARIRLDLSREDDREDGSSDDQLDDDSYGPEPSSAPVEAGEPRLENVVFVLLGAIAMLLVVGRVVAIPT
ncbi:DUF7312 domain-containing protein [Natrarchaeobaculum sulfurireducens]|uniref:DUF7312 domain-containing protein n=1 Tax=Natrarchaeobaculum sulfurireducens TaxID=2044521 RepID=A0A346PN03_9EURY|nr:hypothetical protein [Natrarchaeobaculum sulfurireducens]AXR80898.1 hypothetical protein AArcMg_0877 [Natrarchaeobaculum sulfurireducens]